MPINAAEVQWDDAPAPKAPRAPNQTFYNPQTMPKSLDIAGLYGDFQQQFPGARVTSTRRTPQANARLPNAVPDSFHLTGEAWDAVPSSPEEESRLVAWGTQNGLQAEVERAPYHVHFEPPARGISTSRIGGGSGGAGGGGIDPSAVQWDDGGSMPQFEIRGGRVGTPAELAADSALVDRHRASRVPVFDAEAPGGVAGYEPVPPKPAANASLFRMDSDFRKRADINPLEEAWGAAKDMFGGHESAAKWMAERAGGKVDTDADGAPVVVLPDGTRYRVNDKGFDSTDAANVAGNVAAAYLPASWASNLARTRQIGTAGRMALQAGVAAGTDAAEQVAVNGLDVDAGRVALAGVGGAGGEGLGSALGAGTRMLTRAGASTARAQARTILQRADAPVTTDTVNALSRRLPELDAGTDPRTLLGNAEFGLTYTRGQRALDPKVRFNQLSREELLRQSPGGAAVLRDAEAQNVARVGERLTDMGERLGGKPGTTPAELAQGAGARLRSQADDLKERISSAYDRAGEGGRTAINADAIRSLPQRLRNAVRDFPIDYNPGGGGHHGPPSLTMPATAGALQQIERATASILGSTKGATVKGVTLKALDTQRRILSNGINAATTPADRAAMTAIKREFDGWLDESIDTALASGDPASLQALKEARGLRAEFGRRFEGREEADRFITGLLDGTRTPEELVNIALGSREVSRAAGARFVQRLKDAAGNDPEVIGQLRAAHFLRLTHDAKGQPLGFQALVGNIRRTEYSNASVVKALYSPAEWNELRRLASALEPLVAKGDFAKSSGSAERGARMLFQKMGSSLPFGFNNVFENGAKFSQWLRANSAVNAPLKLKVPSRPGWTASGATAKVAGD